LSLTDSKILWWQASVVATTRMAFSEQQAEIKVVTSNSQPVESARTNPYRVAFAMLLLAAVIRVIRLVSAAARRRRVADH
jgi:hypothetical protein